MVACLAVTAFCVAAVPRLTGDQHVGFLLTGAFSVNQWIVDIGLSSWVSKRGRLFIAGVLLAGMVEFLWMVPPPSGMMIRVIPVLICGRLELGFVHFLYSRWVWKFSDPQVRATIGRDLLAAAGSPTHHLTLKQSLPAWHGE